MNISLYRGFRSAKPHFYLFMCNSFIKKANYGYVIPAQSEEIFILPLSLFLNLLVEITNGGYIGLIFHKKTTNIGTNSF